MARQLRNTDSDTEVALTLQIGILYRDLVEIECVIAIKTSQDLCSQL